MALLLLLELELELLLVVSVLVPEARSLPALGQETLPAVQQQRQYTESKPQSTLG